MTNPFKFGDKVALKGRPTEMGVVVGWPYGLNIEGAETVLVQWEHSEDDYYEVDDLQHWDAMQWKELRDKVDGSDVKYRGNKGGWTALVMPRKYPGATRVNWDAVAVDLIGPHSIESCCHTLPEYAKIAIENSIDRFIALKRLEGKVND